MRRFQTASDAIFFWSACSHFGTTPSELLTLNQFQPLRAILKYGTEHRDYSRDRNTNAVVTPLRKAASYEQRKTNLEVPRNCNVLSRSATYYAALTRVSSLPPRRRHDSR